MRTDDPAHSISKGYKEKVEYHTFIEYSKNMNFIRYVYWQDDDMWLGYLEEYPDYQTQGETFEELQENLKDICTDLTSGAIPNVKHVGELQLARNEPAANATSGRSSADRWWRKRKGMSMSRQSATQSAAISKLAVLYDRNGYVRRYNPARRKAESCMSYKKGDEIRLVANTVPERVRILKLLRTAGFKPGRPFLKGKRGGPYRVPLYGREQVACFLGKIEETKRRQQRAAGCAAQAR